MVSLVSQNYQIHLEHLDQYNQYSTNYSITYHPRASPALPFSFFVASPDLVLETTSIILAC